MAALLLLELGRNPTKVRKDVWCYDGPDLVSDGVLESLSLLQAQLKVQRVLQTTAKLLRQHPSNKPLPNQQANRVKHLIKFVFESTTRGTERQSRFRKLDCNALKLCGLCYKIRDILELPSIEFDFLVANVADFIHRHKLTRHLYREDINKAVYGEFDPEDDSIFREFLKSHVDLRPAKRKRDESSDARQVESEGQAQSIQGSGIGVNTVNRQIQYMFSKAPRSLIQNLRNPLSDAVQASNQWETEESLGEETTDCMSTLVPRGENEDISITLWVGRREGVQLIDAFKQQRTWSALPSHLLLQPQTREEHHAPRSC